MKEIVGLTSVPTKYGRWTVNKYSFSYLHFFFQILHSLHVKLDCLFSFSNPKFINNQLRESTHYIICHLSFLLSELYSPVKIPKRIFVRSLIVQRFFK